MKAEKFDVVTIGAGSAGLVTAIGLGALGKKSALVEARLMGGDCTNFGCIPSKALIAAAKAAHVVENTHRYNLGSVPDFEIDFTDTMQRVRNIVENVRSHESPEELEKHNVKTIMGYAAFTNPHEIQVTDPEGTVIAVLQAKNFVIATGTRTAIPPIANIESINLLTNETLFELTERPNRLIVIGGGATGCELGQAMSRLGSNVTMVQRPPRLLPGEEAHTSQLIENVLRAEGIDVLTGMSAISAELDGADTVLTVADKQGNEKQIRCDAILASAGRRGNFEKLNLENAGVKTEYGYVKVNKFMQTTQPHIYAGGDIVGGFLFTHVAEAEARVIVRNIMFPLIKSAMNYLTIPWATYIDPEVAHVGLLRADAEKQYGKGKIGVYNYPFHKLDRAITESEGQGFVEILTVKWSGRIIGATIVASRAGDMLAEICLAMKHKIPIYKLSGVIHAYPTFSLGVRKTADLYFTETLAVAFNKLRKLFSLKKDPPVENVSTPGEVRR